MVIQIFFNNKTTFSLLFLCCANNINNVQITQENTQDFSQKTIKPQESIENQKPTSIIKHHNIMKETMYLRDYFFFTLIQIIVGLVSSLLISFFWNKKNHYSYKIKNSKKQYFDHINNCPNFYETVGYFFVMCLAICFFIVHTYFLKTFKNIPIVFSFFYFLSSFPFCFRKNYLFFRFLSFFNPVCFSHQTLYLIKYIQISLCHENEKKKAKVTKKETTNHFMQGYYFIMLFFILIQLFIIRKKKFNNIFFVFPNLVLFSKLSFFNINDKTPCSNTCIRISLIDIENKKQTIGKISILKCSPLKGQNWNTEATIIKEESRFIYDQTKQPNTLFLEEIKEFKNQKNKKTNSVPKFHLIFSSQNFSCLFGVIKGQEQYTNEKFNPDENGEYITR